MNQAWKLTAITLSRVRYQQSKVISLGLGRTIVDVDENITDPETRNALYNKIRGGAAPRLDTDALSDARYVSSQNSGTRIRRSNTEGGGT